MRTLILGLWEFILTSLTHLKLSPKLAVEVLSCSSQLRTGSSTKGWIPGMLLVNDTLIGKRRAPMNKGLFTTDKTCML